MTTKKRSFYLNMNYSKVNRQCWSNQTRGYKTNISKKNPLLLCIGAQTQQRQRATCFTSLNQSWRNQSSKANKEEKRSTQSIRSEPVIQSPVTAVYSPVTAPFTFPSLDPSLSLFPPRFSVPFWLSLFLSISFFPHASSRSSLSLAPAQNEPPLHSGTLFLWQCKQAKQVSRIL